MPRTLTIPLRLAALLLAGALAWAGEPVVVVGADSRVEKLTRDEVINLFMGRQKRLPGGVLAVPLQQAQPETVRARFYQLLVDKDLAEINTYWARLFFSGQAQPPELAGSAKDLLKRVARTPGAVAIIDGDAVDHRVRVVFMFGK